MTLHRVTETIDPLGRVTTYMYDAGARTITEMDPNSVSTTYQYNSSFLLTTSYDTGDPLARVTSYTYGTGNLVTAATDGAGVSDDFVYTNLVPEPPSLLPFLGGLAAWLGLGLKGRRRATGAVRPA